MLTRIKTVGDLLDALKDMPRETPIMIRDNNPEHQPKEFQNDAWLEVETMVKNKGTAFDMFDGTAYPFDYYTRAKSIVECNPEYINAILIH